MNKDLIINTSIIVGVIIGIFAIPWALSLFFYSISSAQNFYCEKKGGVQVHNYENTGFSRCAWEDSPSLE